MKKSISQCLSKQTADYYEKIKEYEKQVTNPGFNFCHFFLLKEGLAFTLQRAGLILDSLLRYQELETLLESLHEKKSIKLFESFLEENILSVKNKDSFSVVIYPSLSNLLKKKPNLREEMYKNTISEFSMKCYLFSRQSDLIFSLKQPNKVAVMSIAFIRQMYKELKRVKSSSEMFFCERWAYQAYIDIINDCDFYYNNLLQDNQPGEQNFDIYIKGMSDLLGDSFSPTHHHLLIAHLHYLSRKMLDKIGVAMGYLPSFDKQILLPPYENKKEEMKEIDLKEKNKEVNNTNTNTIINSNKLERTSSTMRRMTNSSEMSKPHSTDSQTLELVELTTNDPLAYGELTQKQFDQLYIEATTNAAIRFKFAENMRNNEKMTVDIALIDYFRKDYKQTSSSIDVLCRKYLSTGWKQVGYSLLYKLAHSQYVIEDWPNYLISCLLFVSKESFGYTQHQSYFLEQFLNVSQNKLQQPLVLPKLIEIITPSQFYCFNYTADPNFCGLIPKLKFLAPPPIESALEKKKKKKLPPPSKNEEEEKLQKMKENAQRNQNGRLLLEIGDKLVVRYKLKGHLLEEIKFEKVIIKWSKQFLRQEPVSPNKKGSTLSLNTTSLLRDQDLSSNSSSNSSTASISTNTPVSHLPHLSHLSVVDNTSHSVTSPRGKEEFKRTHQPKKSLISFLGRQDKDKDSQSVDHTNDSNNSVNTEKNEKSKFRTHERKKTGTSSIKYDKIEKDETSSLVSDIQLGVYKDEMQTDESETFEMVVEDFVLKSNEESEIEFSKIVDVSGDFICNSISFNIGNLSLTQSLMNYNYNSIGSQNNLNRKLIRIIPTIPTASLSIQSFPIYLNPFVDHPSQSSLYAPSYFKSNNPAQSIRFSIHTNQDDHIVGAQSYVVFFFKHEWINLVNQSDLPLYLYSPKKSTEKGGEEEGDLVATLTGAQIRENKLLLPDTTTFYRNHKLVVYLPISFSDPEQVNHQLKINNKPLPIDFSVSFRYLKLNSRFNVDSNFSITLTHPFSVNVEPISQNKENSLFLQVSVQSLSSLPILFLSHSITLPNTSISLLQDYNSSFLNNSLLSPNEKISLSFLVSSQMNLQQYDYDLYFQLFLNYQFIDPTQSSLYHIHSLKEENILKEDNSTKLFEEDLNIEEKLNYWMLTQEHSQNNNHISLSSSTDLSQIGNSNTLLGGSGNNNLISPPPLRNPQFSSSNPSSRSPTLTRSLTSRPQQNHFSPPLTRSQQQQHHPSLHNQQLHNNSIFSSSPSLQSLLHSSDKHKQLTNSNNNNNNNDKNSHQNENKEEKCTLFVKTFQNFVDIEKIKVSFDNEKEKTLIQTTWDNKFSYKGLIPLPIGGKKKKFDVILDFNKQMNLGELNELEVVVKLLPQNSSSKETFIEYYEDISSTVNLQVDTNSWLVVGYQDSTFVLSVSQPKKIKYKLLPLFCGQLSLPTFKVVENNDSYIFSSSIFPKVTVIPKATFITSTVIH